MCECGNTTFASGTALRKGTKQSCGCLQREASARTPAMISRKYPPVHVGDRYGKLTVIAPTGKKVHGRASWICICDCGNTCEAMGNRLTGGKKLSCGCYCGERLTERNTTHGGTGSRLYGIWRGMKSRCYNPNVKGYAYYGGKGVVVCDEWVTDFAAFRDWSLSNGYSDDLTIDRIDGDGPYSPDNCRWTTWDVQRNNQHRN